MTSRITFLTIALMIGIALLPKAAYAASCAEAAIEARGE